jgi:hypothetical protein
MKASDVEYYSDQINFYTPCLALKKRNYITAVFLDGKKKAAHTEDEADQLWKECREAKP